MSQDKALEDATASGAEFFLRNAEPVRLATAFFRAIPLHSYLSSTT